MALTGWRARAPWRGYDGAVLSANAERERRYEALVVRLMDRGGVRRMTAKPHYRLTTEGFVFVRARVRNQIVWRYVGAIRNRRFFDAVYG